MLNRILIDPQAFAAHKETQSGQVLLRDLAERAMSGDIADDSAALSYTLTGGVDKWQRPFLDLHLSGSLKLHCQRCMKPMPFVLDERAHMVLFTNETVLDKAMETDDELEGLLLEAEMDVLTLVEDQLLIALPFSPMHDACEDDALMVQSDKTNPFAVLAGVKKSD